MSFFFSSGMNLHFLTSSNPVFSFLGMYSSKRTLKMELASSEDSCQSQSRGSMCFIHETQFRVQFISLPVD